MKICPLLALAMAMILSLSTGGEASEAPSKLFDLCKEFNSLNTGVEILKCEALLFSCIQDGKLL